MIYRLLTRSCAIGSKSLSAKSLLFVGSVSLLHLLLYRLLHWLLLWMLNQIVVLYTRCRLRDGQCSSFWGLHRILVRRQPRLDTRYRNHLSKPDKDKLVICCKCQLHACIHMNQARSLYLHGLKQQITIVQLVYLGPHMILSMFLRSPIIRPISLSLWSLLTSFRWLLYPLIQLALMLMVYRFRFQRSTLKRDFSLFQLYYQSHFLVPLLSPLKSQHYFQILC